MPQLTAGMLLMASVLAASLCSPHLQATAWVCCNLLPSPSELGFSGCRRLPCGHLLKLRPDVGADAQAAARSTQDVFARLSFATTTRARGSECLSSLSMSRASGAEGRGRSGKQGSHPQKSSHEHQDHFKGAAGHRQGGGTDAADMSAIKPVPAVAADGARGGKRGGRRGSGGSAGGNSNGEQAESLAHHGAIGGERSFSEQRRGGSPVRGRQRSLGAGRGGKGGEQGGSREGTETMVKGGGQSRSRSQRSRSPMSRSRSKEETTTRNGEVLGSDTIKSRGEVAARRALLMQQQQQQQHVQQHYGRSMASGAPSPGYAGRRGGDRRPRGESLLSVAVRHQGKGNYAAARRIFEMLAKENESGLKPDGRCCLAWGRMEAKLGDLPAARRAFARGIKSLPDNVHIIHAWAIEEQKAGNVAEARKLFEFALDKEASDGLIYQAYALLEQQQGNMERAEELLQAGTSADPGNVFLWSACGVFETRRGNLEAACRMFQQATVLGPSHCPSFQAYAIALERSGLLDESALRFQQALDIDSRSPPYPPIPLISDLPLISLPPSLLWFHLQPALRCILIFVQATRNLKACYPGCRSVPTYQAYGLMEARRGNHDKARELFQKGIDIDQKHAPIFHAWATMEAQLGEYNRSILPLSRLLHCLPLALSISTTAAGNIAARTFGAGPV